ncbi:MAG TPA: TatD family hydrolase [Candidatus Hydrogenedentes bacterium]|nr:TatD family hydrolase [Candidatus Hydrogenedentota bacterium]
MLKPVDSHCHLQDPKFDADRAQVMERASDVLSAVVVVGDTLETSVQAVALTQHPKVWAVIGMHPYNASRVDRGTLDTIRDMARESARVVAIGETGLDYYNEFSPRSDQRKAFEMQARLAAELRLPLVVHNRQADADTLALLREFHEELSGIIMHCFESGPGEADAFAELGCCISFAGNLTYPRAGNLRDAARRVPDNLLLVETDAPYLAPQSVRGRRCEPALVTLTVAALAELRGEPPEFTADRTARNAARVYGLNLSGNSENGTENSPDV